MLILVPFPKKLFHTLLSVTSRPSDVSCEREYPGIPLTQSINLNVMEIIVKRLMDPKMYGFDINLSTFDSLLFTISLPHGDVVRTLT